MAQKLSVDRTVEPYEYLKRCFYQDRITMVNNERLLREFAHLELNSAKNKVDHPPRGSKDVADAVCGAVYAASQSRLVRAVVGYLDNDGELAVVPRKKQRPTGMHRQQGKRRPQRYKIRA